MSLRVVEGPVREFSGFGRRGTHRSVLPGGSLSFFRVEMCFYPVVFRDHVPVDTVYEKNLS